MQDLLHAILEELKRNNELLQQMLEQRDKDLDLADELERELKRD